MLHTVPTGHTRWCDRLDLVLGTPECSRRIGEVDDIAVMLYGQPGHPATVALAGDLGHMVDLSIPHTARLAAILADAQAIATADAMVSA